MDFFLVYAVSAVVFTALMLRRQLVDAGIGDALAKAERAGAPITPARAGTQYRIGVTIIALVPFVNSVFSTFVLLGFLIKRKKE